MRLGYCKTKKGKIITIDVIIKIKKGGIRLKFSARNQLKGKVVKVEEGAVNGVVTIELPGGQQVVSSITMSSIKNLGLEVGKEAYAIVKASSVMVGVDE